MFVTGPNVVKTVTHEEVTAEELGGARTHASKSGVAHLTAPNEVAAIDRIKDLLGFLPQNCEEIPVKLPYTPGDESQLRFAIFHAKTNGSSSCDVAPSLLHHNA